MNPPGQSATDEELMLAYVAGDDAAFRLLFERYAPRLIATLRRGSTEAEAVDLCQQTFLQVHRARKDFQPGARVRPWIFTIALNLQRTLWRRAFRRTEVYSDEDLGQFVAAPDDNPEAQAIAGNVREAVARLPEKSRHVIEMHWFQGVSLEEIAASLGDKPGAVRVRAHRAYKQLRGYLEESQ